MYIISMIKTWDELREVIAAECARSGHIFVRWSRSPKADERRGYSLNHASMSREPGLSVQTIDLYDANRFDSDIRIALYLLDYRFCGPVCSLWSGELAGRGGDNEDTIVNAHIIGIVHDDIIIQAIKIRKEAGY